MADAISSVADLASLAINKLWPDKSEAEKQQLAAAVMVIQGQLDINKEEAKSTSLFVSGWRPAIGWVCVAACSWNWVLLKALIFAASVFEYKVTLAPADLTEMMPILLGMLGLGGLRTLEKFQGVAAR